MAMVRHSHKTRAGPPASATRVIVLLLIFCFVQCATEQRINNRGSKPSNVIEKINGWRSQRGGSCLSYGHSCWGAHGKRSGKLPAAAPDWYLTRMLRRMAESAEMNQVNNPPARNSDINTFFETDLEDAPSTDKLADNDGPVELPFSRSLEAKPMLDDNMLSKLKMWQILKNSIEEK